jgi:hypothetical protein
MWIGLAVLLLVVWALLKFAFAATSMFIHILIVLAVISLIWHFVAGARNRV